jgi:hypothetical protein
MNITSRTIYKIPVKILRGFECEIWQANRRKVLVDWTKHWKIDGITPMYKSVWTANINHEALRELGVEI